MKNEPAFPTGETEFFRGNHGMSKRYWTAVMAMQATIYTWTTQQALAFNVDDVVQKSFQYADAMMEQEVSDAQED